MCALNKTAIGHIHYWLNLLICKEVPSLLYVDMDAQQFINLVNTFVCIFCAYVSEKLTRQCVSIVVKGHSYMHGKVENANTKKLQ